MNKPNDTDRIIEAINRQTELLASQTELLTKQTELIAKQTPCTRCLDRDITLAGFSIKVKTMLTALLLLHAVDLLNHNVKPDLILSLLTTIG